MTKGHQQHPARRLRTEAAVGASRIRPQLRTCSDLPAAMPQVVFALVRTGQQKRQVERQLWQKVCHARSNQTRGSELDNTLVLWIWGDNGASMEGTITGSFNELTMQNGIPLTDERQTAALGAQRRVGPMGCPIMDPHYSAAWAWAGNTPFQ